MKIQKVAYLLITLVILIYILIIGRSILIPLTFGIFFTLMIAPVCNFLEEKGWNNTAAIITVFFTIIVILTGVSMLFGSQLITLSSDVSNITDKIESAADAILKWTQNTIGISKTEGEQIVNDQMDTIISSPFGYIQQGIASSTTVLANSFLVVIITFLLLLYRKPFRQFIIIQFSKKSREEGEAITSSIQEVVQEYLYGMLLVILILGVLNSLGLWIIGIEYALFWGFLAAMLAIIPYIGTALGGVLPFLYAIATTDTLWQPIAVVVLYGIVQQLEGNFITPKIVGSSVDLNPLFAILALILGGMIWGVAGLILFIPIFAIIKIFFSHIEPLMPVSEIMGSNVYDATAKLKKYDKEKYRMSRIFE